MSNQNSTWSEEKRISHLSDEQLSEQKEMLLRWLEFASDQEAASGETQDWTETVILLNEEIERRQVEGSEVR